MAGELIAGLGLFKSMLDMAKGLKDINDAAVRNPVIVELTEKIFAAQQQQAALVKSVSNLEAEVVRLKAWDAEKQRYELQEIAPGVTAYRVKEAMRGAEPIHWLCANCYHRGEKSVLQAMPMSRGIVTHGCSRCSTEISYRG